MSDTYFVAGGVGFVGSFLAAELLADGEDVVLFDVRTDHPLQPVLGIADEATVVRGDVTYPQELERALRDHDPDYVVHLAAALTGLERSPWRAIDVNCTGTSNVFAAACDAGVERVVWTSSTSVYAPASRYGDGPRPVVDEDSLVAPASLYGACKFFDERLAEAYHDEHGLDVVGLRPPGIYGPFKSVPEPHNELVERAARGESTTVPYGDQRVELVYVRDVARALRRACEAGSPSRLVYNLGADYVTYREAARAATEVLDGEVTATDEETMSWTHDVDWSAARDDLGYEPRYAFREGIAEHAELLEAAGD